MVKSPVTHLHVPVQVTECRYAVFSSSIELCSNRPQFSGVFINCNFQFCETRVAYIRKHHFPLCVYFQEFTLYIGLQSSRLSHVLRVLICFATCNLLWCARFGLVMFFSLKTKSVNWYSCKRTPVWGLYFIFLYMHLLPILFVEQYNFYVTL